MTNKQIIIDGIDVSGCSYFNFIDEHYCDECSSEFGCAICDERTNCYYKQLKRKEQECEELREALNEGCLHNLTLMTKQRALLQTLAEIKEIAKEQIPYLDTDESKTMEEVKYDYVGKIYILEQRMYKILQKISDLEV